MFYVYVYYDPRPASAPEPIYVGKGTVALDRAGDHWERRCPNRFLRRVLGKIREAGFEPAIEIVAHFDDEREAFALECALIKRYGRRDNKTGTLCNLTSGGEGTAGLLYDAERLARTVERCSDHEWRAKMSAIARTSTWGDPEVRAKIIASHKQRLAAATPEWRAKCRASIKASRTPDLRSRIARSMRHVWSQPEYREALLAQRAAALSSPAEVARKSAASKKMWAGKRDQMIAAIKAGKQKRRDLIALRRATTEAVASMPVL